MAFLGFGIRDSELKFDTRESAGPRASGWGLAPFASTQGKPSVESQAAEPQRLVTTKTLEKASLRQPYGVQPRPSQGYSAPAAKGSQDYVVEKGPEKNSV